jgi:hypothetical protein
MFSAVIQKFCTTLKATVRLGLIISAPKWSITHQTKIRQWLSYYLRIKAWWLKTIFLVAIPSW